MTFRIVYDAWWMRKGWGMVVWPWMWFGMPKDQVSVRLFRHELEHCYQVAELGRFRFYVSYVLLFLFRGYKRHPYEVEARYAETRPLTPREQRWFDTGEIKL